MQPQCASPFAVVFTRRFVALLLSMSLLGFLVILLTNASVFGVRTGIPMGESMGASVPSGSLMLLREADPNKLAVGDVISFRQPGSGQKITHRIVGVRRLGGGVWFTTKGDANPVNDAREVGPDTKVYTAIVDITYLGYVLMFLGPALAGAPAFTLAGTGLHSVLRRWLPANRALSR